MGTNTEVTSPEVIEVVHTVADILAECEPSSTDGPADKIVRLGQALVVIGESLRPLTVLQARRVIKSAAALHDIRI